MTLSESLQDLLVEGKLERALSFLKAKVEQDPADTAARLELLRVMLSLKQFDEVSELLSSLFQENPSWEAELLEIRGLWHQMQEHRKEAREDYVKALQRGRETAALYYNLGHLLTHQAELSDKDARNAESYLTKALELEPHHFQAQFDLAALYTRTKRLSEAILACEKTLEINPLHIRAYFFLGELFSRVGSLKESIELYRAGLSHNPRAHVFRDELIRLYKLQGNLEKALEFALEQSKLRGTYEDFLELGTLAIQLNQSQVAEIAFLKAEQTKPDDWKASYNLGELYRGVGAYQEALKAYERSLEKAETAQSHTGLGLLALENEESSDPKIALGHFQRALDLESENPAYIYNFALVLNMLEDTEELKKLFRRASQVIPESEILKKIEEMLS